MADVASVGGKNASLGEMRKSLTPLGIRTPDGFATTADAYRAFLRLASLEGVVRESLASIDIGKIDALQAAGARVRSAMLAAPLPADLTRAVQEGYRRLEEQYGPNCDVAVRSSATAEDLPDAGAEGRGLVDGCVSHACRPYVTSPAPPPRRTRRRPRRPRPPRTAPSAPGPTR